MTNMINNATCEQAEKAWDTLLEMGVSEQTLQIITCIDGYSLTTLEDVIYAYAGYNSFNQIG